MSKADKVVAVFTANYDVHPPKLKALKDGLLSVIESGNNGAIPQGVEQALSTLYNEQRELQLEKLKETLGDDFTKNKNIEAILNAIQTRHDYLTMVEEREGGIVEGGKQTLEQDKYKEFINKKVVESWLAAAKAINGAEKHKTQEDITILYPGGTESNKLNAYIAGRGSNIFTVAITFLGADDYGKMLREEYKARGIKVIDFGKNARATKLNAVITGAVDGTEYKDRFILKGISSNELDLLKKNKGAILAELKTAQRIVLEGSAISKNKLGHEMLKAIIDMAIENNIGIVISPCTDPKVISEHEGNAEILQTAYEYGGNDLPTGMNVSEMLGNYSDLSKEEIEQIRTSLDKDDWHKNDTVKEAFAEVKEELQTRQQNQEAINAKDSIHYFNQPIAIISKGGDGLYIITPDHELKIEADVVDNIKNTVGAGDNMIVGAWVAAVHLANGKRNIQQTENGIAKYSEEDLKIIAKFAKAYAKAAIQSEGASVDQKILQKLTQELLTPSTVVIALAKKDLPNKKLN